MRKRGEVVERSFAHMFSSAAACAVRGCAAGKKSTNDTSSMSRVTISEFLFGAGTPKETAVIRNASLFVIQTAEAITVMIVAVFDADWRR